jgi:hypothetical protein
MTALAVAIDAFGPMASSFTLSGTAKPLNGRIPAFAPVAFGRTTMADDF